MTQWGYIDLSYRTLGALPDPILGRKFVTACLESNYPNTILVVSAILRGICLSKWPESHKGLIRTAAQ